MENPSIMFLFATCFFSIPGFCISETDGVTVRVECPNSGSIPGIDEFLCSLDGGIFFGCKRVFVVRCFVMGPYCFWF